MDTKNNNDNKSSTQSALTVGRLAKKFGLSRSTLLYYDTIRLLSPSSHMKGEYRTYSGKEEQRLEQVCHFRKAGIPLKDIKKILDTPDTQLSAVLENRLKELNDEIVLIRKGSAGP